MIKTNEISLTNLHFSCTELPSGTMTSDDVLSSIKSGGITTSKYPICKIKYKNEEEIIIQYETT